MDTLLQDAEGDADREMDEMAAARLQTGSSSSTVDLDEVARSIGVDPARTRLPPQLELSDEGD